MALGPVDASASILVDEVVRAEELAERGCLDGINHSRLEIEEDSAWDVLAARRLVVEHVDAVELRKEKEN